MNYIKVWVYFGSIKKAVELAYVSVVYLEVIGNAKMTLVRSYVS